MKAGSLSWQIITGEYPPRLGGVSDYTRQVACGLAQAGDSVCIWTSETKTPPPADPGIEVKQLPGEFGFRALRILAAALKTDSPHQRIFVQYLPQLYGMRGMNLPFCLWLLSIRRFHPWVMFHEVAVATGWRERWRTNVLGFTTKVMARIVGTAADRRFISVPNWAVELRRVGIRQPPPTWLPIPSNVDTQLHPEQSAVLRTRIAPGSGSFLLGHFGTYGVLVTRMLAPVLSRLLGNHPDWSVLLIGRESQRFAAEFLNEHPTFSKQITAVSDLSPEEIAVHLGACDLLLQPYADGASSRRTSLMAGLALGVPIVATTGVSTEAIWQRESLISLASSEPEALTTAVERLADSPEERRQLGERGRAAYNAYFSLERTIQILRGE